MSHEIFNRESFELCARTNLEYALGIIEGAYFETTNAVELARTENAAATIRELLAEDSAYFERAS